jgi:hypothetical protein
MISKLRLRLACLGSPGHEDPEYCLEKCSAVSVNKMATHLATPFSVAWEKRGDDEIDFYRQSCYSSLRGGQ